MAFLTTKPQSFHSLKRFEIRRSPKTKKHQSQFIASAFELIMSLTRWVFGWMDGWMNGWLSGLQKFSESNYLFSFSFGVGRTGVFCLLSTLLDQLEKEQSVDVYQTAKLYRLQRPKLIETEVTIYIYLRSCNISCILRNNRARFWITWVVSRDMTWANKGEERVFFPVEGLLVSFL